VSEDNIQQRLAYERTQLANERTFAAWLRTGITISALGLGFAKIFPEARRPWLPLVLGALFGVLGIIFVLFGAWRFSVLSKSLSQSGDAETSTMRSIIYLLAILVALLLLTAITLSL
jgi:putative membrane protein